MATQIANTTAQSVGFWSSLFSSSYTTLLSLISTQGYLALFLLMTLESAALPIPSEIIIPLAGYLSAKGLLNIYLAFVTIMLASAVGITIDYYIGYFVGKDIVYKHLSFFHIKKESLDAFDSWFAKNGAFAVFVTRFVPEVRALMSFPAGFAKMDLKQFYIYSLAGCFIWNTALLLFGYYLGTYANSLVLVLGALGIFVIVLYLIYALWQRKMRAQKHAQA